MEIWRISAAQASLIAVVQPVLLSKLPEVSYANALDWASQSHVVNAILLGSGFDILVNGLAVPAVLHRQAWLLALDWSKSVAAALSDLRLHNSVVHLRIAIALRVRVLDGFHYFISLVGDGAEQNSLPDFAYVSSMRRWGRETLTEAAMTFNWWWHILPIISLPLWLASVSAASLEYSKKQPVITPHAYVMELQINVTRSILTTSSKPVKQIAQDCGYSKLSVFCSAPKSKVGRSPMECHRRTS